MNTTIEPQPIRAQDIHLELDEVVLQSHKESMKPKKSRMYVSFGAAYNVYDIDRRVMLRAVRKSGVVEDALAHIGYSGIGYKFSMHAGCNTCQCSPGFILDVMFDTVVLLKFSMTVDERV